MSISDADLDTIRRALAADGLICHVRGAEVRAIIERLDEAEAAIGQRDARLSTDELLALRGSGWGSDREMRLATTAQCLNGAHAECRGVVFIDQACTCGCHDPQRHAK